MDLVSTIQSYLYDIEIIPIGIQPHSTITLVIKEWWRIAIEKIIVHDSRIREDSSIKHAHCFVRTKVNKVFASDSELGVASIWTTEWADRRDNRNLVVKIGKRC
jgi:hypothetical protein